MTDGCSVFQQNVWLITVNPRDHFTLIRGRLSSRIIRWLSCAKAILISTAFVIGLSRRTSARWLILSGYTFTAHYTKRREKLVAEGSSTAASGSPTPTLLFIVFVNGDVDIVLHLDHHFHSIVSVIVKNNRRTKFILPSGSAPCTCSARHCTSLVQHIKIETLFVRVVVHMFYTAFVYLPIVILALGIWYEYRREKRLKPYAYLWERPDEMV